MTILREIRCGGLRFGNAWMCVCLLSGLLNEVVTILSVVRYVVVVLVLEMLECVQGP